MLNLTKLKTPENLIQDYDVYYLTYKDLLINALKIYIILFLISIAFYNSVSLAIFSIVISLIYPFFIKKELIKKRKEKLLYEFKDFLRIIKTNLEASYSIENSFLYAKREMQMMYGEKSLMYNELLNMCRRIQMNISIEKVFDEFAKKTKAVDIQDFSDSLMVTKEFGGNFNKTINNVISIINDKIEVERDIMLSTASKRFEQNIMSMMPFLIILYLNFSSRDFLLPLYNTVFGKIFMTFLLGVYFLSVYISKKILEIEC